MNFYPTRWTIAILGWILLAATPVCRADRETKKLACTVLVQDENGEAIPDAKLLATKMVSPLLGDPKEAYLHVKTDAKGRAKIATRGIAYFAINVSKEGYYTLLLRPELIYDDSDSWLPPKSAYTVVLEKKGPATPMYVKLVESDIPLLDQDVGFDLEAGDWVEPHGTGQVPDLVFHVTKEIRGQHDYTANLTVKTTGDRTGILPVNHPGNGITNMDLNVGKEAPTEGYTPEWKRQIGYIPLPRNLQDLSDLPQAEIDKLLGYWIRVRPSDIGGERYGKIVGPFMIDPISTETAKIHFLYYQSPEPGDRTLEWDLKSSLVPRAKLPNQRRH